METKAAEIADYARAEIQSLSDGKIYESTTAMYNRLAELSDLSRSSVRQFHLGIQPNLGIENLDRLVAAIKSVRERLRAA